MLSSFSQPDTLVYNLEPMVYKVRALSHKQQEHSPVKVSFGLERSYARFILPEKIYGTSLKDSNHVFTYFKSKANNMGVLLTGCKGSGKSLTAKIICNMAIDIGLPVIMVEGLYIDKELINYLTTLNNCCIYLDEFGKLCHNQELLLNCLTDTNKKVLWLFANAQAYTIHPEFKDRVERVRYHIEYGKVSKEDIIEYCNDHNVKQEFLDSILDRYNLLKDFSFDQLAGLVSEHLFYPELSLEEISKILNFKGMSVQARFLPKTYELVPSTEVYDIIGCKVSLGRFLTENGSIYTNFSNIVKAIKDINYFQLNVEITLVLESKTNEYRPNIETFTTARNKDLIVENLEVLNDELVVTLATNNEYVSKHSTGRLDALKSKFKVVFDVVDESGNKLPLSNNI